MDVADRAAGADVSRQHVLKLLRDAAHVGFIERTGASGEQVIVSARLADATFDFVATVFVFLACCAREAMALVAPADPGTDSGTASPVHQDVLESPASI